MTPSATPLVRMAELRIDPAALDDYTRLLREEIQASVAVEPGVLALHAVSVGGDPAHIHILEIYADRRAYEAHLLTPHFLHYKAMTASMVVSLRLIEADPVVLCAKGDPGRP